MKNCNIFVSIKHILYIMELRIKEVCKEKGILFKELAEKLNISDIALRASLKGNPTIGTLEKVANALDVSIMELFEKPNKDYINCPNCGAKLKLEKITKPQ